MSLLQTNLEQKFRQYYSIDETRLTKSMTKMDFSEENHQEFKSEHWGQRKLLMTEVYFLTVSQAKPGDLVIYVGAASGQHIVFLSNLFPNIEFHLYDPEPFAKQVKEYSKSHPHIMKLFERKFEDEDAQQYSKNFDKSKILFLSDIRSSHIDDEHPELDDRELHISLEMKLQQTWASIISPRKAMFKFRLRFNCKPEQFTDYFDGQVIYQPWARLESAELRLITDCKSQKQYYDNMYEKIMVYHNRIRRNLELKTLPEFLYPIFDVQMEYDIWKFYLIYKNNNVKQEHIIQMMYKTSNKLTCFKNKQAKLFRNVFLKVYWVNKGQQSNMHKENKEELRVEQNDDENDDENDSSNSNPQFSSGDEDDVPHTSNLCNLSSVSSCSSTNTQPQVFRQKIVVQDDDLTDDDGFIRVVHKRRFKTHKKNFPIKSL